MLVRDFDFDLPPGLIAQEPAADRSASRLLCLPRTRGPVVHATVAALPARLDAGDVLVVNNTRVFPARLIGRRMPSGGAVECLLVAPLPDQPESGAGETWEALMHPGQKLKPGSAVVFDGTVTIHGEVRDRRFFGRRSIRLWTADGTPVADAVERIGHVPLPPYIRRQDRASDKDRYQTVFARASASGSIAAPTAGLHFSPALLAAIRARGVDIVEITLHVGYGTFQPVRSERVEEHRVEPERYEIAESAAAAINQALGAGRRIIAVGTTTTRTLEGVGRDHGGRLGAGRGTTDLFIYPGFEFRIISGLLTNFHLPQSSLLMLVCAFAGRDRVLAAYREAIAAGYRFYSYGDAMLIV